jgi:hypothetical protein
VDGPPAPEVGASPMLNAGARAWRSACASTCAAVGSVVEEELVVVSRHELELGSNMLGELWCQGECKGPERVQTGYILDRWGPRTSVTPAIGGPWTIRGRRAHACTWFHVSGRRPPIAHRPCARAVARFLFCIFFQRDPE